MSMSLMDQSAGAGGSILSRLFFGSEEPMPVSPSGSGEKSPPVVFEVPSALLRYRATSPSSPSPSSPSHCRCTRGWPTPNGLPSRDSSGRCECVCGKHAATSGRASKSLSSYSSSPRSLSLEWDELEAREDDVISEPALPCSRPGCPERSPEASPPPRRRPLQRQPLDCVGDGLRRCRRERHAECMRHCQCAGLNGHSRVSNGHGGTSILSYALQELSMRGLSENCLGSTGRRLEYQALPGGGHEEARDVSQRQAARSSERQTSNDAIATGKE